MQVNGMKLRREIARKQLTITDFAKCAGLSLFSLYRAMKGSRANTRTLGKLAAALNIDDPCDLLLKPEASK